MSSKQMGEGYSADTCARKFPLMLMGDRTMSKCEWKFLFFYQKVPSGEN